ncbi:putative F-box protein At3g19560 [Brassica napus]|uniref:putative F-box protein At3g19560 n=1 Tax=Brassica napus TaxID=3708 RepID=UPI002078F994|nr:putative F-box protein At3g19560 [Brassica napus]
MTRISDLSQDLIEEILSRVPLTSQRAARSTCKQWNGLYKDECFTKKHRGKAANDTMMIRVCNSRACLVSVDLQGVRKQKKGLFALSTEPIGQLNHITASDVYHCDGLLLCLHKKGMVKSDTVVWNPYLGQARWIKPSKFSSKFDRFLHHDNYGTTVEHEIFNFKSDSWRVLHLTPDWIIPYKGQGGLSLKGNTYFVAREGLGMRKYVICFDFTSERFRHCLDLESNYRNGETVILSAVREEQLAVLFYREDTNAIEIRITRKIEANEESWRTFLKVDVQPFMLSGMFSISPPCRSFFVDEKKKVAIICDNHFRRAYMIGEDNYFKIVAQGKTTQWPVVCSYVPSSVQIPKGPVHARGKRKVRDY